MPASAAEAYEWHRRPGAFERLAPPWQDVRVLERSGDIETPGSRVVLSVPAGPLRMKWVAEHQSATPGEEFFDVQVRGPFARWEHRHRFVPTGATTCRLVDEIDYALPLGGVIGSSYIRNDLERMFAYRHETTTRDLEAHARYKERGTMKVAITGASGLVGKELTAFLTTGGHEVAALQRGRDWDPDRGTVTGEALNGVDAVVHLAGESIAAGRWNDARKERIRTSRVKGTRAISEAIARTSPKPSVLISASAIGYYGDRGDEPLTEDSAPGDGFLAEVCQQWEAETAAARDAGIRVVNLRIGIVLSPKGGALQKMLTPFKMGAGGVIGSGEQYMSWIALDDLVGLLHHSLMNETSGPVNGVAPNPVTNREFTKTLGRVLSRPTIFPLPAFAAKLAMGEMADELLLSSARVSSRSDYTFRYPTLDAALRHVLGR